ncbi:MAG: hypothetical protein ACLTBE_16155 [Bacteroides thetaiotaomicron]
MGGTSFPPLFGQRAAIVAFDSLRRFLPDNDRKGQEKTRLRPTNEDGHSLMIQRHKRFNRPGTAR